MLGGRLLHGGDYNPDQWLTYPEVFEEDVRLMKEANVNCVSLGIFAWASLEPEEGRYELDWLDHIISRLEEEDIQVVLATPSGAMPHWLTQKYPEVMQVQADGRRNLPGKRHNFCYTSPVMRKKTAAVDRELARRFGKRKNVILWHISNELGVVPEEIDAPSEEFENQFAYGGTEYPARRLCAIVRAKEHTEILSVYEKDFYAQCPVVTRNTFGEGKAYYLAAESDLEFLRSFYGDVFREAGLNNALGVELPYGVTVTERTGTDGKKLVFVMNFKNEPVRVEGVGRQTDAESGKVYEGYLELGAFGCIVLN